MKMTRSTGNVFRDVGFGRAEAENLRLRAELMVEIKKLIATKGLTQTQAAKLFDVSQPRISDLMRGKIDLFTIDMLVNMLARGGRKVVIQTKAAQKAA